MTTRPRGKASTPARPGVVIKQVLMGTRPLLTGETATEAAIVDLHNVYKQFIYEQNQLRSRDNKLKGMVYSSFLRLFKFAQLLNLVELVREEPMLFPPPGGKLYSVRKTGSRVFAMISKRRIFKLSAIGEADDKSWTDLCRAWREQWAAPQKLEVPVVLERPIPVVEVTPVVEEAPPVEAVAEVVTPVEAAPPPKKARKPRRTKAEIAAERAALAAVPTLKLADQPSQEQYSLLLSHLQALTQLGLEKHGVQLEVDRLATQVGDWVVIVIEALEDATSIGYASRAIEYRHLRGVLTAVDEALLDRDVARATESLRRLL